MPKRRAIVARGKAKACGSPSGILAGVGVGVVGREEGAVLIAVGGVGTESLTT